MRMFRPFMPALLALATLIGMTTSAAAQRAALALSEADYEGVEKAYRRVFTVDFMAMFDAEDPAALVTSTIQGMKNADLSDDDDAFNEDGMSTGGLWAKLPSAETIQGEVETLSSVNDVIAYPTSEGTPAS